ncbi:MAG: RNA polymerase subunit sigma [Planctomycetota bacterium]|nr:MAG: RNA polymerase subunit sigma [Planctomycetota bacterium]
MKPNAPHRGPSNPAQLTLLLDAAAAGDAAKAEQLLPLVYDELRRLARRHLDREREAQTLQATALVHEAWVRLVGDQEPEWSSRRHFFGAAAQAMRRILIERARRRDTEKHGAGRLRLTLSRVDPEEAPPKLEILALDEALHALANFDPRMAEIVELRFFAGLEVKEVAASLGISERTVKREWAVARAWLHRRMGGGEDAK